MSSFDIDFDPSGFFDNIDEVLKIGKRTLGAGVLAAAEALKGDSTDRVPFDRGFAGGLASTARASNPKFSDDEVSSEVSYNLPQAVTLHEDMSLNIKQRNTTNGQQRQQKYLEGPMKEFAKDYGKIMSIYFSKAFDG